MKKIKYFIFTILMFCIGISFTNAASLKVSANKSTVVVGNTVVVTVNASGAAGWEYCLSYDSSLFSLSSTTSDTGSSCVRTGSTLIGYSKVTFTLKAKKSGSATITLKDAAMYGDDGNVVASTVGSVKVTAKTQAEIEASYSTDANLKSLSVEGYDITPQFDKNTSEYELEVENEIEKITIKASKSDSSATVSGIGEKELTEGLNKFEIVVTAEKGNKKTYIINVTRKELNPINVFIDGEEYTIVRKVDVLEAPTYYSSTEIEIENELVPAYKSDITGYILVGLKDVDGDIDLYRYDSETGKYVLYVQLGVDGVTLIPLETSEFVGNYKQVDKHKINNKDVNIYTDGSDSDFVLVYGMNAKTGDTNWYRYDLVDGTFQRYEEVLIQEEKEFDLYFVLACVFIGLSFITIILVIVLITMNSKLRKKNKRLVEIVEETRNKLNTKEVVVEKKEEKVKEEVVQKNEEIELSQREKRRLEKQKELELQELRNKNEEFLKTEANEIIQDDIELEDSTPTKKKGKSKKE